MDLQIANFLVSVRNPELVKVFLLITFLGKLQIVFGLAIIASVIFWFWKKKDYIFYLWLALTTGGIFGYLLKLLIHRDRPVNSVYFEHSFSFPSGHAIFAMIFYGFLAYVLARCIKTWWHKVVIFFVCFIIILAIGFSRLYLGVHYVSDVLGGYLLGFFILIVVFALYKQKYKQINC
ncbi:MAG: phosphatase PAP2 family protein [bacterium]|nr:phosphatase PAP2 family protein [bacterium]